MIDLAMGSPFHLHNYWSVVSNMNYYTKVLLEFVCVQGIVKEQKTRTNGKLRNDGILEKKEVKSWINLN